MCLSPRSSRSLVAVSPKVHTSVHAFYVHLLRAAHRRFPVRDNHFTMPAKFSDLAKKFNDLKNDDFGLGH